MIPDFAGILDLFFRRRPPLDALMWHTENIEAGKSFTIPAGKIYEVYINPGNNQSILLNGHILCADAGFDSWFPKSVGANLIVTEWTVAGAIYSATNLSNVEYQCTHPFGWVLSEKDVLSTSAGTFVVRWRDVTHRQ